MSADPGLGGQEVDPKGRAMANSPLFSMYRGGENRVTSSMIAVSQRLELSLLERLLGAVAQEIPLQLVAFVNQPAGVGASLPDARTSSQFDFWFETKTVPNALGCSQLLEHYRNFTPTAKHGRLFIVTPDAAKPRVLDSLEDDRIIWFNVRMMSDAINDILDDTTTFVGEQTRFLLRELQQLFIEDGLIEIADVVVVAARFAWAEYIDRGVYICQLDRLFRFGLTAWVSTHMARSSRRLSGFSTNARSPSPLTMAPLRNAGAAAGSTSAPPTPSKPLLKGERAASVSHIECLSSPIRTTRRRTPWIHQSLIRLRRHRAERSHGRSASVTRACLPSPNSGITTTTDLEQAGG